LGRRDDDFLLRLERGRPEEREQLEQVALAERPKDTLLLISGECIGAADKSLGRMLMTKFLYSLTETERRPTAVVIVSSGVQLASSDSESLEALHALEGAGVDVMICRDSAEFLNLTDKIAVGRLCDMYQIVERLLAARKTLTI
jgi:intracellular sulfur oxidation DsrE/DsrF family protein